MAKFKGTIQEFHHYFGPRIRNKIQSITKRVRNSKKKICDECHKERNLESAHVHVNGRRPIIERVLRSSDPDKIIECDLGEIEEKIIAEHYPLEKNFRFLCKPCHRDYDRKTQKHLKNSKTKKGNVIDKNQDDDFPKLNRIQFWATKKTQISSRIISAYLSLLKEKNVVSLRDFEGACEKTIPKFRTNYASMKTDKGNSHGKVFYEKGDDVLMYTKVRQEVEKYFVNLKVS